MKYLPIENITYKTKLKKDEIIKRLSDYIESEKVFRISSKKAAKFYEGRVNNHEFDIKRIIDYRNALLPRINGIMQRNSEGTIIKVSMIPNFFVIVFLFFWCVVVGFACILAFIQSFIYWKINPVVTLIPIGMLAFVYITTMIAFKHESSRSKDDLKKLFEADIIDEKRK